MDIKKSGIRAGAVLVMALAAGHLVQTLNDTKTATAKVKPSSVEQVSAGADTAPGKTPVTADTVLPATASLGGVATDAPKVDPAPVLATEPILEMPAEPAPVLAALPETDAPVVDGLEVPSTELAKTEPPVTLHRWPKIRAGRCRNGRMQHRSCPCCRPAGDDLGYPDRPLPRG
jgi:hypothetical protein